MFCMTKNSKLPYLKVNLTIPLLDICDEAQNLLEKVCMNTEILQR